MKQLTPVGELNRAVSSTYRHNEVWKPVVGFEGLYEVSNLGRVLSLPRQNTTGGIISQRPCKSGHLTVSLWKGGKGKTHYVHHIVLEAFVGECPTGEQCRHLDGVPDNNRLDNLKWGTRAENYEDSVNHGTAARGERSGNAKLCELDVWLIRNIDALQQQIADFFEISQGHVSELRNGKKWKHIKGCRA